MDFLGSGAVLGWSAPTYCAQEYAPKKKAIFCGAGEGLAGQTGAVQSSHEEIAGSAGTIAGEHPSRAIRAVGRRRKAYNEKPGRGIPKARNGLSPVVFVAKRRGFAPGHLLAVDHKPRAGPAGHNFFRKRGEPQLPRSQTRNVPSSAVVTSLVSERKERPQIRPS